MLADDTEAIAIKSAGMFNDPRVHQFYNSDKHAGKVIANCLGWNGKVAWDTYLFYEAGLEWVKTPPQPADWMHQLKDSWADRAHYRTGDDLADELFMTMKRLLEIQHR
jgi:hypothetical protein